MNGYKVRVASTGAYLPGQPVTFDQINSVLGELSDAPPEVDKWIKQVSPLMKEMLGIEQYHYAIDPTTGEFSETNITMSVKVANIALEKAGMKAEEIDLLIYTGACIEQMPTISTRIQEELGIGMCAEMSIHANCTSTYKGIMLAQDLISIGRYKNVMVISSNMASSTLRAKFFNQKMLKKEQVFLRWFLCDGAGCIIFKGENDNEKSGLYLESSHIESLGCGIEPMMYDMREAYAMNPLEVYEKGLHHINQRRTTFENVKKDNFLASVFEDGLCRMRDKYEVKLEKTKYFQINFPAKHVYDLIKERCCGLGIPESAYYTKLDSFGYAGPPMALICIDCLINEKSLEPGDQIISFVTEVSKIMQAGFMLKYY